MVLKFGGTIMKKICALVLFSLFLGASVFAQSPSLYVTETDNYRIYSEIGEDDADSIAKRLEAYLDLFNNYLRFDLTSLEAKMNVRIFENKDRFDEYLTSLVGETRNNFVYIQYSTVKKSELVCYDMDESEAFESALIRHSFIQFLKSFVKNPPYWLQQGFAVFFERSTFDPENQFAVYHENLGWLDTLKERIGDEAAYTDGTEGSLLTLTQLLNPSGSLMRSRNDIFHAQSWGFITFLLNSENKEYNRLLWDAVSAMEKENSYDENVVSVQTQAFQWVNEYLLYTDFTNYISSVKTFPELVNEGVELYALENFADAEKAFIRAIALDGSHFIPYYYLGLIHYANEDYSLAEYYYQSALMLGAEEALLYYALGVNAFADGRMQDAENYLIEAVDLNQDQYAEKVETIMDRIEAAEMSPAGYSEEDERESE